MKLSPHFSKLEAERSATAAKHGIVNRVPDHLLVNLGRSTEAMEQVRALLDVPLIPSSWYRCPALNRAVGGSLTSQHMKALAVDFEPKGLALREAFDRIAGSTIAFDQLIIERTKDGGAWIHLGLHETKSRREVMRASGVVLGGEMHYRRVAAG